MLNHYLMFNKNCAEALNTYTKAFDAEITELQKYDDMPPNPAFPIAESDKGLILHARIEIDGTLLMCADSSERSAWGDNMYVSFTTKNASLVQKAWDILIIDGKIHMDLEPSFFATLHGSLQDKFGINWMFTALK